jgi:uncharacterized protein (TIGR02996 family)
MDELAFLRAISAAPDDMAPRLVYADWLDERMDPRGEFVHLQVRLRELSCSEPEYEPLRVRERALRLVCPPEWLTRLDPPVWCVVGNIVKERPAKHGGIARGTRQFRPNAQVYLATLHNALALIEPPSNQREYIEVVGRHRLSREWIRSFVGVAMITNWRIQLTAHPALVLLREARWPGFGLRTRSFNPPEGATAAEAIAALFSAIGTIQG